MLYSEFRSRILTYLRSHVQAGCPTGEARILLGLSGGLDSRVMLELLATFRQEYPDYDYQVVHVHHGLSPDADDWATQCMHWCHEHHLPFQLRHVHVDPRQGGIEQSARQARYRALHDEMDSKTVLLTAQHLDDQSETFLLALKRGSGPKGLSAMPEIVRLAVGWHARPLLNIPREALETFAEQYQLSWVEDKSNQDTRYDRNFLRHDILPLLNQRWPEMPKAIARSAALCAEQEAVLQLLLQDKLTQLYVDSDCHRLNITGLVKEPIAVQRQLLRQWFAVNQCLMPSQAQLKTLMEEVIGAKGDANPQFATESYQLRRFQQELWLLPLFEDVSDWSHLVEINTDILLPNELGLLRLQTIESDSKPLASNEHVIAPQLLTLGLRQPADDEKVTIRFAVTGLKVQPHGRTGGRRKLKKLYQEYDVPSWQRTRLPMIFFGDELAAIAGLFTCSGFEGDGFNLVWAKM